MTNKNNKNQKDREEYGYGYDRSVDDLQVIGQNNAAKKEKSKRPESKK